MEADPVLDQRLHEWGTYCMNVHNNRIGYPTQSSIVAMIEVGIFSTHFGPREPFLHPRAMIISTLMMRLSQFNRDYYQALQDYYFFPYIPRIHIAKARGISLSTFKARITGGKVWLSGALEALEMKLDK